MNIKRAGLFLVLLVGLVLAGISAYQVFTVEAESAVPKSLVGSWNVDVTVLLQNHKFPGLFTFYSDGNLTAESSPSQLETTGHGAWEMTGPDEATYAFVFLIGNTKPDLWLKGTVSGNAVFDPKTDQWSGLYSITIVDQNGNEVIADTGTMSGMRITSQPTLKMGKNTTNS